LDVVEQSRIYLEYLQEFPKPTLNLNFFGKIEKSISPITPYLNSQSFCSWENQFSRVEIYEREKKSIYKKVACMIKNSPGFLIQNCFLTFKSEILEMV
jgi:hypothetical protein